MSNLLNEYSDFVDKTYKYKFGDYDLLYLSNGMGGEVGEAQNEIKKMYRLHQNTTLTKAKDQKREEVKKELGDVLWYLTAICNKMDFSLGDIIAENIEKNKKNL